MRLSDISNASLSPSVPLSYPPPPPQPPPNYVSPCPTLPHPAPFQISISLSFTPPPPSPPT